MSGGALKAAGVWAAMLLGGVASAPPVQAHAMLRRANPPVGSTVGAAPAALQLSFTEAVEPAFSTVVVTDAAGTRVDHGAPAAPDDPAVLAIPLGPLPAGTYTVVWHVISVDTHRTEGSFTFTVAP